MAEGFNLYFKIDFEFKTLEEFKEKLRICLNMDGEQFEKEVLDISSLGVGDNEGVSISGDRYLNFKLGDYLYTVSYNRKFFQTGFSINDLREFPKFLEFVANHPYLQTLSARGFDESYYNNGEINPFFNGFDERLHPITILNKEEAEKYDYKIEDIPAEFVRKTKTGGLMFSVLKEHPFVSKDDIHRLSSPMVFPRAIIPYFEEVKKK